MHRNWDLSTRRMILTLLKTRGHLSVNELSGLLGITEMAVRRHLNTLEGEGYVSVRLLRQSMGRPTHIYSLTELADGLFPKNYHRLTLDLLGELEKEDAEMINRLFERREDRLAESYESRMLGKTLRDRVEQLAEIQNDGGYMVQWEEQESGGYILHEYNCPISQVAQRYEQACRCELSLFKRLLGAEVERTECLAKGGQKCSYRIYSSTSMAE